MVTRTQARAARVRRKVDLGHLLRSYGYDVYPDAEREQQFRCDLHGSDNKPSARFYPATNSTYCWVCQKSRGPLDYVMEKEGIEMRPALDLLEAKYDLGELRWSDEAEDNPLQRFEQELQNLEYPNRGFEDERKAVRRLLDTVTRERDLDLQTTLKLWEVYDRLVYGAKYESWGEKESLEALQTLKTSVFKELKARAE